MLWCVLIAAVVCSGFGGYASAVKGRPILEGLIFGAILGPFGVVAAASLPELVASGEWPVASEQPTEPPVDVDQWDMSQTLVGPRDARMPRVRT